MGDAVLYTFSLVFGNKFVLNETERISCVVYEQRRRLLKFCPPYIRKFKERVLDKDWFVSALATRKEGAVGFNDNVFTR